MSHVLEISYVILSILSYTAVVVINTATDNIV